MIEPDNTIKLGADTFTVTPLPALRTFLLQPKIAPALAEVGKVLAKAATGGLGAADVEEIMPVIEGFFTKMDPDTLGHVVRELLGGATMNGQRLFTEQGNPFDVLMRGRTMQTWQLLWFAIRVNFPDFFGLLGNLVKARGAGSSGESSTSSTSGPATGSSSGAGSP